MWIIYLITILDAVCFVTGLIAIISLMGLIIAGGMFICSYIENNSCGLKCDTCKTCNTITNKIVKICLFLSPIFTLITILLPNSKQAATILAVGGTIEYVKSNEKIKELPNKMVDCLDKYIDDYLNEEKSE